MLGFSTLYTFNDMVRTAIRTCKGNKKEEK